MVLSVLLYILDKMGHFGNFAAHTALGLRNNTITILQVNIIIFVRWSCRLNSLIRLIMLLESINMTVRKKSLRKNNSARPN